MSQHACLRWKTLVFCADTAKANNVLTNLGVTVAPDGLVAGGTAVGHAHFIEAHGQQDCDHTWGRVDLLVSLERLFGLALDPQTNSTAQLQQREAHPSRNTICLPKTTAAPHRGCNTPRHVRHSRSAPAHRLAEGAGCASARARGYGSTALQ